MLGSSKWYYLAMSIFGDFLELFESPKALLRKLQDPSYLATKRATFVTPADYQQWLRKKYTVLAARQQINEQKGRTQDRDIIRQAQEILLAQREAHGIERIN
jgi:hypothetical protein